MKSVLVTGGAGFLGSNLCERLLASGSSVICIDNYLTGSRRNILHLEPNPSFQFIKHDIQSPFYMDVDEIYNLACPASPVHYQRDPIQTTKICFFGAINMLGLAKRTNAKILQASTSEVYGDPTVHPQVENYCGNVNPIGPRSCYDEGKRAAESLFFDYHRCHQVRIRVARIFNTYGPGMHPKDGRVVSNFILQALKGNPVTVYGDGTQTRSFCYVDDLVEGLLRMMRKDDPLHGPVNLGNPREITIIALASLVIALTGSRSKIIRRPLPAGDPVQRRPDISKATALLDGWVPRVGLEEGLGRTIAYFDALLAKNDAPLPEYGVR